MVIAGCDVTVFTTTANGPGELPLHEKMPAMVDGVPVYYFKRITKDHSHFSPHLLRAFWKQVKQFDVVHIHAWWNTVSLLSALIAIVRGVPTIVSPRGTLSNYSFHNKNAFVKKCIHNIIGKPVLKRCTVHATSSYENNTLLKVINPKQIITIPNFIQLPKHIGLKDISQVGPLKLIFLSRIEEKKGLDLLLNELPKLTIPYHLTIAGSGDDLYTENLKQLALQNNVGQHISWTGFQGENKFNVLADHHLLILPSYDENFGNVVIESLYAGTAVLVSKQVGLADYVAQNNLGWVSETHTGAIANTINTIDRQSLSEIAQISPGMIKRDFNEAILIKRYTEMYQQVIQHG